jgi:hypothetical protein
MLASDFGLLHLNFSVLLLLLTLGGVQAVCPYCFGNFASCTYDTNKMCPTIDVPAANAAVVAAGAGVLSLAKIIKPRFLRALSTVSFDTILALVKRAEPGAAFEFDKSTPSTTLLTAVANGRVTLDVVVLKLCEFMELEEDDDVKATIKTRLDCISTATAIRAKASPASFSGLFDTGILTFMLAKVSTFVMEKGMQIKLSVSTLSGDKTNASSDMTAKLVRPQHMWEFSEMLNLFIMYAHALAISSSVILTDFFEHVVYDTIRLRGETWTFAFELLTVMFRRIEDSGGRLHLANAYEETYLNTVMDEARANEAFFRPPGGKPGAEGRKTNGDDKKWNKKFAATGSPCQAFNLGKDHTADMLKPDGTCRFNHVCDHWVRAKGKRGRCLCEKGTPGHNRTACDNPDKCDEPVA